MKTIVKMCSPFGKGSSKRGEEAFEVVGMVDQTVYNCARVDGAMLLVLELVTIGRVMMRVLCSCTKRNLAVNGSMYGTDARTLGVVVMIIANRTKTVHLPGGGQTLVEKERVVVSNIAGEKSVSLAVVVCRLMMAL